jgi:hypothetical protein
MQVRLEIKDHLRDIGKLLDGDFRVTLILYPM